MKKVDKILFGQIRENIGTIVLIVIFMIVIVMLNAVSPWSFKILIDNVLSSNPLAPGDVLSRYLAVFNSPELLGFFAVAVYFLSMFFSSIVDYLNSVRIKQFIKRITSNFSKSAFRNLEALAIGYYNKQEIGDYIYRLSYDVSAFGDLVEDGVIPLLTSTINLVITITVMLFINVQLTLLALFSLPLLAFGLYVFDRQLDYTTKRNEFYNSLAFSFIEEALLHLKVIQAFSQEKNEADKFNKKIDMSLESDVAWYKLDYILTMLVGVIVAIIYSVIMVYGIRSVFSGTLTTGLLIVFIFYMDNLTSPITSIIYALAGLKKAYVKISRMEDLFNPKRQTEKGGKKKDILTGDIVFKKIDWVVDGKKILDNISFDIEGGKRTVIFGMNGSGKSSIANLILRFSEPTTGKIYVDGINISEYNLEALRENISYIPQEITLFDDTIYENIAFGDKSATPQKVHSAAKLSTASDFIKNHPHGFKFKVGEAGNALSGGQRQRLMIARALMKDKAKILIFDETFSALDVKTRETVLHNIRDFSENKTTIIISNIFSVISAADNVIVLHQGKVIYHGPAKHLSKEANLYKIILENS